MREEYNARWSAAFYAIRARDFTRPKLETCMYPSVNGTLRHSSPFKFFADLLKQE
jgi:hypothetical protein